MKISVVLSVAALLIGGAVGTARAEGEGKIYREGVFERGAMELASCLVSLLELLEPDLHTFVSPTQDWKIVYGAHENDVEAATWAMAARDKGERTSEVKLIGRNAAEKELSELWQMLEMCRKEG